jgi:hypothetical protein
MSVRVPVMTIGSDSGAGVGDESWARKSTWRETGPKKIANVFSALQILLFREENSRQSRSLHSHSSFCEEVFSRSEPDGRIPESVYSERGPKKLKSRFSGTLANEADRFEYSGSWLAARRSFGLTFFPPSPLLKNAQATRLPLQRLACGKSYPVTAAQLLRLHTGFLAPIHCFKLAKN